MHWQLESHDIIKNNQIHKYMAKFNLSSVNQLNNKKLMISYTNDQELESSMLQTYSKSNVSLPVASAITAYARIHMSQFKNRSDFNLFYSDTDSIIINKPLPVNKVGKEIGLMKLENMMKQGVFIAPKVYGGILTDKTEFTKVKGFKDTIKFLQLKSLLNKSISKLDLNQEKWFRSFTKGNITVKNQLYTLQVTENKRRLVYKNNKLIGTTPFIINNNKEIIE